MDSWEIILTWLSSSETLYISFTALFRNAPFFFLLILTAQKQKKENICIWVLLKHFFVFMSVHRKLNADALTTTQLLPMLMSCPHVNNSCSKLITQW